MTSHWHVLALRLAVVALAAGCLMGLVHVLSVIGLHVPFDPNEGWNAYFAQMAMANGTPYPPDGSFLVNNYPPLSFFAIGELGRFVGDNIFAGRIVSLLALLVTAVGMSEAARGMGCDKVEAAFACLLFIACILLTSDYAGMDDPQMLGHAVAIWALVVVVRAPRTARRMVLAALILTLAFFVKHNLILLPVSLGAWLLLVDRRKGLTFILSGLIFLLIGAGVFRETFGTSFFNQIASARTYDFANIWAVAQTWFVWAVMPICAAIVLLVTARRDQYAVLAVIYATVSTFFGLLVLAGAGVDSNALFDAAIGLSICVGLLINRLERREWSAGTAIACLVPLLLLLRSVDGDWTGMDYWRQPMAQDRIAARNEIALLRNAREPVMCEMLSLCYWAGRSAQVDVFNTDQRLRTGAQTADGLVRLIDTRHFSIIQLETLHLFPLPPVVEHAVMQNYQVIRTDDERVFLAPR